MKKVDWRGLYLLTQLGISIMVPPVISLMAAKWLAGRLELGYWVYPVAIVLGIGAAFTSAVDLIKPLIRFDRKNDTEEQ